MNINLSYRELSFLRTMLQTERDALWAEYLDRVLCQFPEKTSKEIQELHEKFLDRKTIMTYNGDSCFSLLEKIDKVEEEIKEELNDG